MKHITTIFNNLNPRIAPLSFHVIKRFMGKDVGHAHKILHALGNSVSKSHRALSYHRSLYSQKQNPQCRNLREKIKLHKKSYLSQHSDSKRYNNSRKNSPEYEYIRTKFRRKFSPDCQNPNNKTEMKIIPEQISIHNKMHISTEETFSPIAMITKSVKAVCNSVISFDKNITPLSNQEFNFENQNFVSTDMPLPFVPLPINTSQVQNIPSTQENINNLKTQSSPCLPCNTFELTRKESDNIPSAEILQSNICGWELKEHLHDNDYHQKILDNFKNKIINIEDKINLKNIVKQMKNYCQEVIDNNESQVYFKAKSHNDAVISLINKQYISEAWAKPIRDHFLTSHNKQMFATVDDMTETISFYETGRHILNKYGEKLPESVFTELIRHHNILINNDAQYTKDNTDPQVNNSISRSLVQPYGEGFTLHNRTYEFFSNRKEEYFEKYRSTPLTKDESRQIEDKLTKGEFSVIKADLRPEIITSAYPGVLLASGDVIHSIITVQITDKEGTVFNVGINSFTSSRNRGTISLGCNQIVNEDPKLQSKEQRCRPFDQALYVPQSEYLKKDDKFTAFATSTNYNNSGLNLREKIQQEFYNKRDSFEKMPIRKIQEITRPFLYKLTNDLIIEDINKLEFDKKKLENELKTLSSKKKNDFIIQRQNVLKNMLQTQHDVASIKTLPKAFQELVKMKNKLDTDIKNKTVSNYYNNKTQNENKVQSKSH